MGLTPLAYGIARGAARARQCTSFQNSLLQPVGEDEKHAQQEQGDDADLDALRPVRLAHEHEVVHQIHDGLVVLQWRHLALGREREFPVLDLLAVGVGLLLDLSRLLALQLPEHMGHADVGKHEVVPAGKGRFVAVERTQIGVEPVLAAGARDHREVGRRGAEPRPAVGPRHGNFHRVAHLGTCEDQVFPDLVRSQAERLESVVTHELCAVTVEAVVHEQAGAPLQGNGISRVDRGFVEVHLCGRENRCGDQQ